MTSKSTYWLKETRDPKENFDLIELANTQRAITNFIKITTGEEIPVEFYSNDMGESMTDGSIITISSLINVYNMDSIVGLALHEGAHCKYTDFDILKRLTNYLAMKGDLLGGKDIISIFLNFIEDRRIDSLVYEEAPGYQGYYNAMYERYFYNDVIDKGLKGRKYREENWESYLFRIINIFNKNTDLTALRKLEEIFNIIDLKNIDRLKSTKDSLDVAIEMYKIIITHFSKFKRKPEEVKKQEKFNQRNAKGSSPSREKIRGQFRKQEQFLKGNVSKANTTKKVKQQLNAIIKSNISSKDVKINDKFDSSFKTHIIEGISNAMIQSNLYGVFNDKNRKEKETTKGINIGKKLLRKLKIRNEQTTLNSHRLKKGKIDNRRIYAANFVDDIFMKTDRTSYKPINLHVSIDGSGSMDGLKWNNTLINTIALGYLSLKMSNINLTISIRTSGGDSPYNQIPLLILAFDSKKDSLNDLKKLGHLKVNGFTPEGICLDALNDFIPASSYHLDSYLINMSDGYPMFYNNNREYKGEKAINHTSKVIKNIKRKGVKILSYFIVSKDITETKNKEIIGNFKTMYGKGASFIDPKNINEVTKTLNNLFLTKNMIS